MRTKAWRRLSRADLNYLRDLESKGRVPALNGLETARVCHLHNGNFTIATVMLGGVFRVGTAKRNPMDAETPKIGERLALVRALRSTQGVRV